MKQTTGQRKKESRVKGLVRKMATKVKSAMAAVQATRVRETQMPGAHEGTAFKWYSSPIFIPRTHTIMSYSAQNRAAKQRRRAKA